MSKFKRNDKVRCIDDKISFYCLPENLLKLNDIYTVSEINENCNEIFLKEISAGSWLEDRFELVETPRNYFKVQSNNVTTFDVDGTLVIWEPKVKSLVDFENYNIKLDYGDEKVNLRAYKPHVLFLKHCFNRGDQVIVWSKNGVEWAEKIVKALQIEKYVHIVMSKPSRHVDDKSSISEIVGDRVFIPE